MKWNGEYGKNLERSAYIHPKKFTEIVWKKSDVMYGHQLQQQQQQQQHIMAF